MANPLLPPDYRPSEDEEFMNPRQREYFRQKLHSWRAELLRESNETLRNLQSESLAVPDMGWGGAAQNGWGISISQRSSEVFAAWFTYGADRRPTWFIASGSDWSSNAVNASLFRVTGRPWLGVPHDATAVTPENVGTATLGFVSAAAGTFTYNVSGVPGVKVILRQAF